MNYYGYPPGYDPSTGSGRAPTPAKDTPQPIAPARLDGAKRVNAQYISPDGEQVCRRHYGEWIVADWRGDRFGAWRSVAEYPDGWVRL